MRRENELKNLNIATAAIGAVPLFFFIKDETLPLSTIEYTAIQMGGKPKNRIA